MLKNLNISEKLLKSNNIKWKKLNFDLRLSSYVEKILSFKNLNLLFFCLNKIKKNDLNFLNLTNNLTNFFFYLFLFFFFFIFMFIFYVYLIKK